MSKAYVISTGIISAIGNNTAENLQSLQQQRHGISMPEILQTAHQIPVAEIRQSREQLMDSLNIRELLPRTALLSIRAAREAMAPFADAVAGFRMALISGNTVGGMDLTEIYYKTYKEDPAQSNLAHVQYHECGAITALTAEAIQHKGWSTTISTACSSSANSIMLAAQLIESGKFDLVLAGGADGLSRFTLNGFNSLMILDKMPCRPFDENRQGLNLGEGAAYLLLAGEIAMRQLQATPLAMISGYANANDAHHQTASSPEGLGNQLAMKNALQQAGISPEAVSYINLHGTGTTNNDSSEGIAIQHVFGKNVPPASSTKAYTGHTLGAAGAVEAVYSIFAIQHQIIFPHLRWETPMQELSWKPATAMVTLPVQHVLSNSFGFGGNCSSLVISKI